MMRLCFAGVLASLCVLGCASRHIAPSPGMGDPYPAPLNDPQISVLSPQLQPWLAFHPARLRADGERPLEVEVPVRNMANRQYQIAYRFLFFDENDLELEPTLSWRDVALAPKQTVRLKANALSPEASSYRLEIKWAR